MAWAVLSHAKRMYFRESFRSSILSHLILVIEWLSVCPQLANKYISVCRRCSGHLTRSLGHISTRYATPWISLTWKRAWTWTRITRSSQSTSTLLSHCSTLLSKTSWPSSTGPKSLLCTKRITVCTTAQLCFPRRHGLPQLDQSCYCVRGGLR